MSNNHDSQKSDQQFSDKQDQQHPNGTSEEQILSQTQVFNQRMTSVISQLKDLEKQIQQQQENSEGCKYALVSMSQNLDNHLNSSEKAIAQLNNVQGQFSSLYDDSQDDIPWPWLDEVKQTFSQSDIQKMVQQLRDKIQHFEQRLETLDVEREELRNENKQLQQQHNASSKQVAELQQQLNESNETIIAMKQLLQQYKEQSNSQVKSEQDYKELKISYDLLQQNFQSVQDKYSSKQKECDIKDDQIQQLKLKVSELAATNQSSPRQLHQYDDLEYCALMQQYLELQNEISKLCAQKLKLKILPDPPSSVQIPDLNEGIQNSMILVDNQQLQTTKLLKSTSKKQESNIVSEETKLKVKQILTHYYDIIGRQKLQIKSYIEENKKLRTKYQQQCLRSSYIPQ